MPTAEALIRLPHTRNTRYGRLRCAPFRGDNALPADSEIVIIGGGIIGAATAFYLAKRNIPVLLCEKAELGCESSSRAFGLVTELLVDAVKQPLAQKAKQLWPDLHAEVGETGYRQHGMCYLAETSDEMDIYQTWLGLVSGVADKKTRLLTAAEVVDRFPGTTQRFSGGLFAPTDGSVEPIIVTAEIAEAARRHGAKILTDCAVRGLDLAGGRVAGVFTEKGYVRTSCVLAATNAWSRILLGNHGVDIPQLYVMMSMGRTTETAGPVGSGGRREWAFREMIDGTYALGGGARGCSVRVPLTRDAVRMRKSFAPIRQLMGNAKLDFGVDAWNDVRLARHWNPRLKSPFETQRVLGGTVRKGAAGISLIDNARVFPDMKGASVQEHWAGAITISADNKPILGTVDRIPGLHLATACSFGISWAPAVGQLMADTMTGRAPEIDANPFRLDRFSDGSPLQVAM